MAWTGFTLGLSTCRARPRKVTRKPVRYRKSKPADGSWRLPGLPVLGTGHGGEDARICSGSRRWNDSAGVCGRRRLGASIMPWSTHAWRFPPRPCEGRWRQSPAVNGAGDAQRSAAITTVKESSRSTRSRRHRGSHEVTTSDIALVGTQFLLRNISAAEPVQKTAARAQRQGRSTDV